MPRTTKLPQKQLFLFQLRYSFLLTIIKLRKDCSVERSFGMKFQWRQKMKEHDIYILKNKFGL